MEGVLSILDFVSKWPALGALALSLAGNWVLWRSIKEERDERNKIQDARIEDWRVALIANTKAGTEQASAMGAWVDELRLIRQEIAHRGRRAT